MKSLRTLAAAAAFALASCIQTTTTAPDGTVTTTRTADPAAVGLAGQALGAYVAIKTRPIEVEATK